MIRPSFFIALLALTACSGREGPASEASRAPDQIFGPSSAEPPPAPPGRPVFEAPLSRANPQPLRYTERVVVPAKAPPPRPRDYEGELRRLAGDPSGCGELGSREDVRIGLSATVTENGVVTRAVVRGVPAATAACLRQRLEAARFRAPVESAPRTVSADLQLRGSRTVTEREREVTMGFVPHGFELQPGQTYAGTAGTDMGTFEAGRPIDESGGRPIEAAEARPIDEAGGVTIMGPSGTAIGGS